MAGFRHNIHPNIKQGLDARVKAMSEYAGQELRSSLLAESQANEDFVLTKEGQVSKNCYIRMISPGTRKTNIIYGMFNIDDARITGESPGADGEDFFQSLDSRVKGASEAFYDTIPNKGHDHPHQQQVAVPGVRPVAGINEVTVNYEGYGGAVRKATVNWTCFTLEQLEMYQKGSFLSSGQNIILDFGWVRSQRPSGRAGDVPKFLLGEGQHAKINQDLFKDTIETIDGVERKTVDAQWDKLEIEYFGDWSGMIGPITKFTWSQRSDGGFDCVTEIISRGSNIFDKSLTALQTTPAELKTYPAKTPTFEEFADELISDAMTFGPKEQDVTPGEGKTRKFTKEFSLPDRIASLDLEIIIKYFKDHLDGKDDSLELKKGVNVAASPDKNVLAILRDTGKDGSDRPDLFERQLDNDGEETNTLKRARDFSSEIWVRWGWFEDNVISYYTRLDKSDGRVLADFRSLDRVGGEIGQLRSVRIKNDPELYTYDPSKFILPGQFPSTFFAKVSGNDTKSPYKQLAELIEAEIVNEFLFAVDDAKTEGYLRNVYINLNEVKSAFSSTGATIQSSMIKLAESINSQVKLWNFTIDKADNITSALSTFRIVAEQSSEGAETGDDKDTSPKNSYVFDNFGFNSLVKNISLQSTIPDKFAITAGFSGARSAGEKETGEDAIKKYFKDGTDDVDEDKFKATGEFFSDPENIDLFVVTSADTSDHDYGNPFEFAHIDKPTPEISVDGLKNTDESGPEGERRWSHTIPPILEKISANKATTKFLDQFKKKHEEQRRKLETKAWENVKAGKAKAEDIQNLFAYDIDEKGAKTYRMPYDGEGKLIESFLRAMKWFLSESPLTRFSANNQGPLTMPINIDMTIEGCGGIYPGDMFRLSYLPEIYGQVDYSIRKAAYVKPNDIQPKTYFSVMGLTHTISSDGWDTQITAVTNKSKDALYEEQEVKDSREKIRQIYREKISAFIKAEPEIESDPPPPTPPQAGGAPPGPPPVNDPYPAPAQTVILEPDDQIQDSIYYDPTDADSYHRIGDSNTSLNIGGTTLFEYDNLDDFMNPDKTLDVNTSVFEGRATRFPGNQIGRATRFPGRPRGSGDY